MASRCCGDEILLDRERGENLASLRNKAEAALRDAIGWPAE
jgi:hypothetical protein